MEIRAVRESELAQVVELSCLAFDSDDHERYWQYVRGDSSYRLSQTRVVVVNDTVVSTLRVWERRIRVGAVSRNDGGHRRRLHTSTLSWCRVRLRAHAGYYSVLADNRI